MLHSDGGAKRRCSQSGIGVSTRDAGKHDSLRTEFRSWEGTKRAVLSSSDSTTGGRTVSLGLVFALAVSPGRGARSLQSAALLC